MVKDKDLPLQTQNSTHLVLHGHHFVLNFECLILFIFQPLVLKLLASGFLVLWEHSPASSPDNQLAVSDYGVMFSQRPILVQALLCKQVGEEAFLSPGKAMDSTYPAASLSVIRFPVIPRLRTNTRSPPARV